MSITAQARRVLKLHSDAQNREEYRAALAAEHRYLCHGDGSACEDGCSLAPDPKRLTALESAAIADVQP